MCQRVPIVRPPDIGTILGGKKRRRRRKRAGDGSGFDDFGSFDEEDFFEEEFDDFDAILEGDDEVGTKQLLKHDLYLFLHKFVYSSCFLRQ